MEKVKTVCRQCGSELPPVDGKGRPPRYCSPACRRLIEYAIRRLDRQLDAAEREQTWCLGQLAKGPYNPSLAQKNLDVANADVERLSAALAALVARTEGEADDR